MLYILRNDKQWTEFHVILKDLSGEYIYDTRSWYELEDTVYGRYLGGEAMWVYALMDKMSLKTFLPGRPMSLPPLPKQSYSLKSAVQTSEETTETE